MSDKPENAPTRRKRSDLTFDESISAVREWVRDSTRMCRSSESYEACRTAPSPLDKLTYKFEVNGTFTDHVDLFEALRVIGGYKLPSNRKAT